MRLWMPIIVPPLAVLTQVAAGYAIVPYACEYQHRFPVHLVSALSFSVALIGMAFAWSAWRDAGLRAPDDGAEAASRERMLAAIGLAMSGLMALAAAAQWMTIGFVPPCVR